MSDLTDTVADIICQHWLVNCTPDFPECGHTERDIAAEIVAALAAASLPADPPEYASDVEYSVAALIDADPRGMAKKYVAQRAEVARLRAALTEALDIFELHGRVAAPTTIARLREIVGAADPTADDEDPHELRAADPETLQPGAVKCNCSPHPAPDAHWPSCPKADPETP